MVNQRFQLRQTIPDYLLWPLIVVGLALARYVVGLEPLATASQDDLAAAPGRSSHLARGQGQCLADRRAAAARACAVQRRASTVR